MILVILTKQLEIASTTANNIPYVICLEITLVFIAETFLLRLCETHNALPFPVFFFFLLFDSRVQNIGASRLRDFRPCQNEKSHACCYTTSSSRKKTNSAMSKNNPSVRVVIRKKLRVILWNAVQKLYKFFNLFLLLIRLFICPIVISFIFLFI